MSATDTMTALSETTFNAIKNKMKSSKARKLIHDDAKNDSGIIAERQRDRSKIVNKTVISNDAYDTMMGSYSASRISNNDSEQLDENDARMDNDIQSRMANLVNSIEKQKMEGQVPQMVNTDMTQSAGRFLPKEIVESFKKDGESNAEALNLNHTMANDGNTLQRAVTENNVKTLNNNIDYGKIQKMIESVVKKYAVALNKRMLSESKTSSNNLDELKAMKIGNQFSFITENGDIYIAKLTYKGNIKKSKK